MSSFDEVQEKLTPMSFAESMYQLEGKPMRFTHGRNYLKAIHNADIPQALLMTGRQVEKTTTVSVKIGNNVLLRPFSRSLYVAPLNEQVKVFSHGRLEKLFRYSQGDIVRKRYMSRELTNQVFHKEYTNGAEIYFRNCYEEADNIRGLSIDDINIDEVQDINIDALPVIRETQTRSKNPHFFLTGTPKTFSNTIQQMWGTSSQAEWVIACPKCRKHQILGVESVSPEGFLCRNKRCRAFLPDIARAMGRWEHREPSAVMKGFRITQMMVPDIDPAAIYEKIQSYPQVKLYNEVLGRSFENADKPFSDQLLSDITDDEVSPYIRLVGVQSDFANAKVFMGIDWGEGEKSGKQGTGYTILSVFAYNKDNKFQEIATKRFERGKELDPDYQMKFILDWMYQFKITLCVADYGGGQKENMRLRKELGGRFFQCHYVGRQKKKLNYEAEQFKYKIPRSLWLTDYIDFVQSGNMILAGKNNSNLDMIYDNFRSIYAEYRTSSTGASEELFYGHSLAEPDDAVHSSFYAWFASVVHKGNLTKKSNGGSIFRGTNGR